VERDHRESGRPIVIPIQPRTMPAGCSGDNRQTIIKVSAGTGQSLTGPALGGGPLRLVCGYRAASARTAPSWCGACSGGARREGRRPVCRRDGQDWAGSVAVFAVPGPDVAGQPFGEFRAAWAVP
jgi:hypothetical protein